MPKAPKIKVTGVTTPITNQVATCKNNVRANIIAIAADKLLFNMGRLKNTKIIVCSVVNKLAGTRKAQIAMQLLRENSKRGSKSNTIIMAIVGS